MARVVVDVMLKPEILDPQGQAVQRALPRLGFDGIVDVRQGKRFELELDGPADEAALARAREIAEKLLANTVIEEYRVTFAPATSDAAPSGPAGAGAAQAGPTASTSAPTSTSAAGAAG
jgi:phosphoribosylformylglycinamidine synthase